MPSKRQQLNIRLSDQSWEILRRLVLETGYSQADLVQRGLKLLARKEGVELSPKKPKDSTESA